MQRKTTKQNQLNYADLNNRLTRIAEEEFEVDPTRAKGFSDFFLLSILQLKPHVLKYVFMNSKVEEYEQGFRAFVDTKTWSE